jgi:hypothetical protein
MGRPVESPGSGILSILGLSGWGSTMGCPIARGGFMFITGYPRIFVILL